MYAYITSLYIGYALYAIFPYTSDILKFGNTPDIKFFLSLLIYVVAVGISSFILRRSMGYGSGRNGMNMAILGLLALGFIFVLLYHVFGITAVFNLPSFVDSLFAPNAFFFYWFAAPLVGLYFLA